MSALHTLCKPVSTACVTADYTSWDNGGMPNQQPPTDELTPSGKRLLEACAIVDPALDGPSAIGRAIGDSAQTVGNWINTRGVSDKGALKVQAKLGISANWILNGEGEMFVRRPDAAPAYRVREPSDEYAGTEIKLTPAKGSCGGGIINWETEPRPPLIKEPSWFRRYGVRPKDALAVWAHGDSMADFIVDGDIVIFDTSRTEPKSGQIFLIDHPDGLRIKALRRGIDGAWVLESTNMDKRRYPDERLDPDALEHLKIVGQFIYRQGG